MAAEGDFRNALAKAQRGDGRILGAAVELSQADGNKGDEGRHDPAAIAENKEFLVRAEALFNSEVDLQVLRLMLADERRTEVYAETMHIGHLPIEEQRDQVKRCKDRISKQIRRLGDQWHESG
jgi:hypothetical protein